ncbi:MAG: site-specific DNA-methyltransferase [Candidatus Methanomethylophilaceae archaeon]
MSEDIVSDVRERYQFTWPDKIKSKILANSPISKTLRPCREESVNFDDTKNLYIEGDNLDALKLLRETYLSKIKMIYIDPPYNTGNDFVYSDRFTSTIDEYKKRGNEYDDIGNKLFKNTDTNGRFHTDWLNMMYPRLRLARDLLSDDGVLFVSIDDNEAHNLRKICDEVFGEGNFIAQICHKSRASISNDKIISQNHNIIMFYAKSHEHIHTNRRYIGLDPNLDGFDMDDNDGQGPYRLVPVDGPGGATKGNPYYEFLGIENFWRFSKSTMQEKYDEGHIVKRGNGLSQKYYLSVAKERRRTDNTWWDDGGLTSTATSRLRKLMGNKSFDTPKPVELIKRMLKLVTFFDKDSTILDFFSGSATTAHAVMELNSEDGGNRKYIMIQLPEKTDEESDAYLSGYKNICEIGKERIRRAGKLILEESEQHRLTANGFSKDLDVGFRVLKIDSSNMKDIYYMPDETFKHGLDELLDNVKEDRTSEDLLFQVMLELGVELSSTIEEYVIDEKKVFGVDEGYLIACFDDNVSENVVTEIAKRRPYYAVMRDNSMSDDGVAVNFEQIFNTYSPETIRRIL